MADNQNNEHSQCAEELRLLYQDSLDNIRLYKRQQWSVTNYGILLFAAIIGIFNLLKCPSEVEKAILSGASLVIFIVGVYFLFKFQRSMVGCRKRNEFIRSRFTEGFREAWKRYDKPDHTSMLHSFDIILALLAILLSGMLAVWWIIYR